MPPAGCRARGIELAVTNSVVKTDGYEILGLRAGFRFSRHLEAFARLDIDGDLLFAASGAAIFLP